MAYFKHFETVLYNNQETVNILNSVIARYKPVKNSSLYYYYNLLDGEQAEDVCYKLYGDTRFWWILLTINTIVDPYHDWLMSAQTLEAFMDSKYGEDLDGIHHFENLTTGRISDGYDSASYQALLDNDEAIPHNIQAIGNREYEVIENEKKRSIKVISEIYVQDIQDDFEALMDSRRLTGL